MPAFDDDRAITPRKVGVAEFRANLSDFLELAKRGTSFLVTSSDDVLAEVRPPATTDRSARRPGALRGRMRIADDFDALPSDVLAAMEGRSA